MDSNHVNHECCRMSYKYAAALFFTVLWMSSTVLFGAVEEDPATMGSSGALTLMAGSLDPSANPAILGLPVTPQGGIILTPFLPSMRLGYFSDVLALTPYKDLWSGDYDDDFWHNYINTIINKSFNVEGLSPSATSRKIEQKVEDGVSIYAGGNVNLFALRLPRLLVDITTTVDCEARVSGVPFLVLFSDKKGLVKGNTLDLTDTRADLISLTRIGVRYAHPFSLPHLFDRIGSWTKGTIVFDQGALGGGVKYVVGNSMMRLRVPKGDITVAPDGENVSYKARVVLTESGTIVDSSFKFEPLAGNGFGIDAGYAMSGAKGPRFGVAMHDLGFVAWRGAKESEFYIACDSLNLDVVQGSNKDTEDDDPFVDTITDTLRFKSVGTRYTMLPLRFSLSAGYEWDMTARFGSSIAALSDFARVGLNYEQHVTRWPGRSRIPKLSIGGENGFLYGVLPLRAGFSFGGAEKFASTFGLGIDARAIKLDVAYKANGSLYFYPRRGIEVALRIAATWGSSRDSDGDKISGSRDNCPQEPEDKDGFNDSDGCPDPDNDNDGILDANDKCPNVAEDKDGFQDEDGCPDYDNDEDKIPDSLDKCPDKAEDNDTVQNADGCPNYDDDGDKIPDSLDKCPDQPEDIDGFEDQDGCPDFDNDKDSIPDSLDQCPNAPEDHVGPADRDGCPSFDTDNDGIPDSVDACPKEAEIYNWINDMEGCPDTLALPSIAVQDQIRKSMETIVSAKPSSKSKAAIAALSTAMQSLSPARFAIGPVLTTETVAVRTARIGKTIELKDAILGNGIADSMVYISEFDRLPASSTDIVVVKTEGKEPIYCAIITGKETWAALQKPSTTPLKNE
jgi:hypothetical protein